MTFWTRRQLLGACLALGAAPLASHAARPSLPLVLARAAPDDVEPTGYLVSEKYDGVRAWWDGQQLRFRSGHALAPSGLWLLCRPAHWTVNCGWAVAGFRLWLLRCAGPTLWTTSGAGFATWPSTCLVKRALLPSVHPVCRLWCLPPVLRPWCRGAGKRFEPSSPAATLADGAGCGRRRLDVAPR